ncbi:MAG: DUF4298 domain-containing protein [Bacteroidales bacterium]|nr:DUF4298 domain-containing protein [Bacteroidales bacterium]
MDKKEILEVYGEDALRVNHYGKVYRDLRKRVNRADVAVRGLLHNLDRIAELEEYLDSGEWLKDFEADERGKFSPEICRDAMTEDAVYELLEDVGELRKKMTRFVRATKPKK